MRIETFPTRAAWLEARRLGVGGSDVPAILGISPWRTPLQVWSEKVGLADGDEDSYTLRRGSHMEGLLYRELRNEVPMEGLATPGFCIVVGAEPWQRYSPDGLGHTPGHDYNELPPNLLVEFKSHPRGSSDWDNGAPEHVVAQVQWGMHVCDLPACYVAVDLGTEFKWQRIERDPAWWPTHEAALRAFWTRVVDMDAPQPGADDKDVLGRIYPEPSGETILLPPELADDAQTLAEIAETMKMCEEKKSEIENRVRAAIGNAERGVLPDGSWWSWSKQSRPRMVPDLAQPKSEFRVLRRGGTKGR